MQAYQGESMNGKLHFELDLPVPVVSPDYELSMEPQWKKSYTHMRPPPAMLSKEFLDWLESKHLHPRKWASPLLFYAHPGAATVVHTDVGNPNLWAMNVVLGTGQVDVHWHSVEGEGEHLDADLDYRRYSDDSPIIESTVVTADKLTVSRISVPHSSRNNGSTGTWLLSLRVAPTDLAWPLLKGRMLS
jgi:hypothetical protein